MVFHARRARCSLHGILGALVASLLFAVPAWAINGTDTGIPTSGSTSSTNFQVINSTGTSSSTQYTLPYAAANVTSGGTISFQFPTASTITLSSALSSLNSVTFSQGSATSVTIDMGSNCLTVGSAQTVNLDAHETWLSSTKVLYGATSFTVGTSNACLLSHSSTTDCYGIQAANVLTIGELGGTVSATSDTGGAVAVQGGTVNITKITGDVLANGYGRTYAIAASGGTLTIGTTTGLIAGTSTADATSGIYNQGAVHIDNLGGTVSGVGLLGASGIYAKEGDLTLGTSTAYVYAYASGSSSNAAALLTGNNVIATNLGGTLSATSDQSKAYGIQSYGSVGVDSLSGSILANAHYGVYGICAENDITVGTSTALISSTSSNSTAYGIKATAGSVGIGVLGGTVSATTNGSTSKAFGVTAANGVVIEHLTGKIIAEGHEGAFGIDCSTGVTLNIASGGAILANADDSAFGVSAMSGGVNVTVANGGTLSATCSDPAAAYAIVGGAGTSTVTLTSGCTIVGNIYLGGTADTLTLTGSTGSTSYSGNISGAENFAINGGYWNLSGSVTGITNLSITGGTLAMNGYMDAEVVKVESDATLGGTASLMSLINYGTVAPGNSIGTIHVTNNFTNTAGSKLDIQINDAGDSDKIEVGNKATLNGGTVNVLASAGSYTDGMTYTFLTAGTVDGAFQGITDNLAFFAASLVYGSDSVAILLTRTSNNYDSVANTYNQHGVARYLDAHSSGATGDFATVLGNINTLSADGARSAYDAMSGDVFGSLSTVGIEAEERFLRTISQRIQNQLLGQSGNTTASARLDGNVSYVSRNTSNPSHLPDMSGWTTWAEGYGVGASIGSNGNASGLSYSMGGAAVGMERQVSDTARIGFAGGYTVCNTALDSRADNGSIDGGSIAMYANRTFEEIYLTGIAAYGYNSYSVDRTITFASIDRDSHANYGGNNFSFYTELGRTIYGQRLNLQPYAGLEYIQLHQNDFTESGASSIDITANGIQADAFRSLLGSRLLGNFVTKSGLPATWEGRAAWRHDFLNENRIVDASFVGQTGANFAIAGLNVDRDAAILGTGLTFQLRSNFSIFANYDVLTSQNYTAHAGSGGLQYLW